MTDSSPQPEPSILVIDDEEPVLKLVRSFLDSKGLACHATTDPREALEIVERRPVDLILTDIHMEGLTGVDVLERARDIDPETIVILMTGKPTVDTAVRSLKADAYDYLTKPFDLEDLHGVVTRALEKQRLRRENAALKDTLTLYQISQAVNASVDEREIVEMVLDSIHDELEADEVALFMLEDGKPECWERDRPEEPEVRDGERRVAEAVLDREEAVLLSAGESDGDVKIGSVARSAIGVPLMGHGRVSGAIVALRTDAKRGFHPAHVKTMTILAGNVATVMENARKTRMVIESRAGLMEANTATIGALVSALDAREHETQVHSIRVTEYALRLAREIDYPTSELVNLKFGAMLHDIGKIGISDGILLKPGPLTEAEWSEMRLHPVIGHRILSDIKFLEDAAEIVLHHHERWDGEGYPHGLKGEEIPLGARLFTVVDTFDSMTSDRPYRDALDYDAVVDELKRCTGTQFDPELVDAFLGIPRNEWDGIAREAEESEFNWESSSLRGGFSIRDLSVERP
ncbi:MAG: response regulator [Gemmatimonadota bacterium]|nr:response regulator [Gemmatimonadota bacterium]